MFPYFILQVFLFVALALTLLEHRYSKILLYFTLLLLIIFSGLRFDVGIDYSSYQDIHLDILSGSDVFVEKGFVFFSKLIDFLGLKFQVVVLFSALITVLLLSLFYTAYSKIPILSIYLFAMLPILYMASFNTIRQFISVAIFSFAVRYIIEKSFFKYLIMISIASLFHKSAIALIILYFILRIKPTYKSLFLYFIFFYIVLQSVALLSSLLGFSFIYFDDIFIKAKINFLIIILIFIMSIVLFFKDKFYNQNYANSVFINMLFISMLISISPLLVTYIPEPFLRLTTYFTIVIPILLVNLISLLENVYIKHIYFSILICMSTAYYYITLIQNGYNYELLPYNCNIDLFKGF